MGIEHRLFTKEELGFDPDETIDVELDTNDIKDDSVCTNRNKKYGYAYTKFRNAVIRRDGGKCVVCKRSDEIAVHHLYSCSKYTNVSTNSNNGICLCKDCHTKFHEKYGNRDNTERQFLEWINTYHL